MICIGVDPGVQGAVVELHPNGRTVARWAAWHPQGSRWGVAVSGRGRTLASTLGGALERAIGPVPPSAVAACEGLFIPQIMTRTGETSPGEVGALHEAAGRAIGILESATGQHVRRPRAGTWRSIVWGRGRGVKREDAQRTALQLAPTLFDWRIDDPFAVDADLVVDERIGLAEAAGIARWLWVQAGPLVAPIDSGAESAADLVGRT